MTPSAPASVEFRLLGPVEAVRDDAPVALGGARQQALLALLLLQRGRPVPADRLVEDLWGESPPPGAPTTLRSYVSRLRSALGAEAPLRATAAGYLLDVEPAQVDAHRFELLAGEGRRALARGAAAVAAERLGTALSLWRGRPFAGVGDDGSLRLEAERLEQLRELAVEERVDAELALGTGAELVTELELLVREQPYRERRWRQLMLALYRAERQADALAAARRARAILRDEVGLEPTEELRRLEQGILRHELPPALAEPGRGAELAAPMSTFVGRASELAEVEALLVHARLVTLTGVGGVGKTRLALEVGARRGAAVRDRAAFVDFSALADPRLVPRRVADALDVRERSGASSHELLVAHLRDAELLLVLDNCEHLLAAVADLAGALLTSCPRLRILATSREPLGVAGEIDYPVPPLALPADDDLDTVRSSDAVELFLARAREVRPRLGADAETLDAAARICRDLDGLPLAIELAAARAKALSLEEIRTRLADRFRFLVSWRRLTDARHRTLREAMDWSYDLLSEDERTLLARLSIFAGGFSLPAAARICLDDDAVRAEELVARLVDASLVVAGERDGAMRYRLLETVRRYAAERLEAADAVRIGDRHAEWALALAEEAEPQLVGEGQIRWFAVLEAEHDNLRAALARLAETGDAARRLRLTIALTRFWYVRGHLAEARARLESALEGADDQPVAIRRRAVTATAAAALLQGDYAVATRFAERALDLARETGEERFVANALSNLGAIVLAGGEHDRAGRLLEEAVALARRVGDDRIAALAINNLGDHALTVGDYALAEPLFAESLALLRARGDTANLARSLFNLGAVALELGRPDDARARLRESVAFAEEAGDKEDLAWCLAGVAALATAEGRAPQAARLLGAAGALLETMGAAFKPFERRLHDATAARASAVCGDDAFAAGFRDGAASAFPAALAEARAELGSS